MRIGTAVASRLGFYYGWWVVFASAFVIFLAVGTFFYGFGALFNSIIGEFGWSRAATSFAFSLRSIVAGAAAPVVGLLVDRVGVRRLMVSGVALVALGYLLLSRIETIWGFYGAMVIIALGMSSCGAPLAMVAITHWFRRRRGRALAVMFVVAGTSGIMVVVLAYLISALGWRGALVAIAIVQVMVALPLALSIRNRPEELGLQVDGEEMGEPAGPAEEPQPQGGLTVREALHTASFWRLSVAVALTNLGSMAIIVHQIPFFTAEVGLSEGVAAATVTVTTLVGLLGRFAFGYLADFLNKRLVLAVALSLTSLSILLFATIYQGWQIAYVLPLFGLGWGGTLPVRPLFQAEYFGVRAFGAIQGLVFTVGTLGGIIGPVLAGWIFDLTDSYRLAFLILAGASMAAGPLVLGIRQPQLAPEVRMA